MDFGFTEEHHQLRKTIRAFTEAEMLPHVMESGQRRDKDGKPIPRKIINKFVCEFNGKPVFTANLEPAIAANPYMQFHARLEESGTFKFTWTDDDGTVTTAEEKITVS